YTDTAVNPRPLRSHSRQLSPLSRGGERDKVKEMKHTLFDERQKLRTRRVAGIPISLLAVILVAGLAVAAIVALGPFSAPVTQTPQAIFAAAKTSGIEPAYGMIESTLGYAVV